ncbi:hypothetical protein LCGC14_2026700 [marine sediment metagenome]|uniref:Uncharacterized protein n=1 Tax=marine sediment metagenome TaxID=412755 RepID=A0A0F9FIJ7_9ZZZZ
MMYCFRKIRTVTKKDYILVFKQGEIQKPIMALDTNDVSALIEEWKRKSSDFD